MRRGRRKKLGRRARTIFEQADAGAAAVYVPAVALVELLEAERWGALRLARPGREWVRALFSAGRFIPADLTPDVVLAAHEIYEIPERRDRLIAATAAALRLPPDYA